jgi:hypothetical protein
VLPVEDLEEKDVWDESSPYLLCPIEERVDIEERGLDEDALAEESRPNIAMIDR